MTATEAIEKCRILEKINLDIWNAKASSEKNALKTAKFCIDRYLAENNITFAEWRIKRINQLTHQHEDKGDEVV